MRVVVDIEANALVNPDKIWCIVCKDIDTNEFYTFRNDTGYEHFKEFADKVTLWIGHNFIDYDYGVIQSVLGYTIPEDNIRDTLVLSRLMHYKLEGGHSLANWGKILGFPKMEYNDWSKLTDEMVTYCQNDVELGHKVYLAIMKHLDRKEFTDAISIEHSTAFVCRGMQRDGFKFDVERALELKQRTEGLIAAIDAALVFLPPKARLIREYNPRVTKHGTISRTSIPRGWTDVTTLTPDCPFSLIAWEPFNPGSTSQVIERLNEAGWKPVDKTKGHIEAIKQKNREKVDRYKVTGWKINENNLATLPEDAPDGIKQLVKRLLLSGRDRTLQEWLSCYDENTGRVHANFNGIGTWTHRMSHSDPNLGNVAAPKSIKYKGLELAEIAIDYGKQMRGLWTATNDEWTLVGTDADQIQLRVFAHYINEPEFIKALEEGDKILGTDVHTLNSKVLGCDRDKSKTFIFAFLLGAGDAKVGEILGISTAEGGRTKSSFIEGYPGLARLKKELVPRDAKRGFFEGLDGRLVRCDSDHLMMAGYLQTGEACVMKHATKLWKDKLDDEGIEYRLVNFVHDEWQTEVRGGRVLAEYVGAVQRRAIETVGEQWGLNCKLAGESKFGRNWNETH